MDSTILDLHHFHLADLHYEICEGAFEENCESGQAAYLSLPGSNEFECRALRLL